LAEQGNYKLITANLSRVIYAPCALRADFTMSGKIFARDESKYSILPWFQSMKYSILPWFQSMKYSILPWFQSMNRLEV
jgi:hypothetical protein